VSPQNAVNACVLSHLTNIKAIHTEDRRPQFITSLVGTYFHSTLIITIGDTCVSERNVFHEVLCATVKLTGRESLKGLTNIRFSALFANVGLHDVDEYSRSHILSALLLPDFLYPNVLSGFQLNLVLLYTLLLLYTRTLLGSRKRSS
jgi:hypothetical protein